MSKQDASSKSSQSSALVSFFLPAISAAIGYFSFDFGVAAIVHYDKFRGISAGDLGKIEAGFLGIAVGFITVIVIMLRLAQKKGGGYDDAMRNVALLFVGSINSVYKASQAATSDDLLFIKIWYYIFILCIIFVTPILFLPKRGNRWREIVGLHACVGMAMLVGGIGTGLIQAVNLVLKVICAHNACLTADTTGLFVVGNTDFFIAAPTASGLLISPWIIVSFDPWLSGSRWRDTSFSNKMSWCSMYILGAAFLVIFYAIFFFWSDHQNGFIAIAKISRVSIAAYFLALTFPAILVMGLANMNGWIKNYQIGKLPLPVLLAAFAVGALLAGGVSFPLIGSEGMTVQKAILFTCLHGATASMVIFAVHYARKVSHNFDNSRHAR